MEDETIDREKIIEKALKIRELANRGIGGEKANAMRMLVDYREKHGITDEDLNIFTNLDDRWNESRTRDKWDDNFTKWFSRSITLDPDNGEPIVFFHKSRTITPFSEFNHELGWKAYPSIYGFHFVLEEDKNKVMHLGNTHVGYGVEFYVYLKMLNPYYLYARLNGESYGQDGEPHKPIDIHKPYCDNLIAKGYDSIIIQCEDYNGYNSYIVFNPNQIKSIDNDGGWTSESDNIFV